MENNNVSQNNLEKSLNVLCNEIGDVRLEYKFYNSVLSVGFVENLSNEDYELWKDNSFEFIKKIIVDDEIYWQIEEMLSNKAQEYLDDLNRGGIK